MNGPLHRIANWEPHPVRVPVILCVLTWGVCWFFTWASIITLWHDTVGSKNESAAIIGAALFGLAAIIQTLRLLYRWEESRVSPTPESVADAIERLERELNLTPPTDTTSKEK